MHMGFLISSIDPTTNYALNTSYLGIMAIGPINKNLYHLTPVSF